MAVDYKKDFLGTAISPSSARMIVLSEIERFARNGVEINEETAK